MDTTLLCLIKLPEKLCPTQPTGNEKAGDKILPSVPCGLDKYLRGAHSFIQSLPAGSYVYVYVRVCTQACVGSGHVNAGGQFQVSLTRP